MKVIIAKNVGAVYIHYNLINKKTSIPACLLCVNTYFDTICVHPIKSAYSLLKCVQLNSQINWNLSLSILIWNFDMKCLTQ